MNQFAKAVMVAMNELVVVQMRKPKMPALKDVSAGSRCMQFGWRRGARMLLTALLLAAVSLIATAQVYAAVSPPSTSSAQLVCQASTVPWQGGNTPTAPGQWSNPNRNGTGWDLIYSDDKKSLKVFLYTFTPQGRPTWLASNMTALASDGTWSAALYSYTSTNTAGTAVGSVAFRFFANDPTRVAMNWDWTALDSLVIQAPTTGVHNGQQLECLTDIIRTGPNYFTSGSSSSTTSATSTPLTVTSSGAGVNQLYGGYWNTTGPTQVNAVPGINIHIFEPTQGPNVGEFSENDLLVTFDASGQPVWLNAFTTTWSSTPLSTGSVSYGAYYLQPNPTAYPEGVPVRNCGTATPGATCVSFQQIGTLTRSFTTSTQGSVSLTYSASPKDQFNTTSPNPQVLGSTFPSSTGTTIYKATGSTGILVDQYSCYATVAGGTCQTFVSWNSTVASSAWRHNLNTNAYVLLGSQANYSMPDTLTQDDRVDYELWNGTATSGGKPVGSLLAQTAEVRAYGPTNSNGTAYVQDAPNTSLSGELPTHDATVGTMAGSAGVSGGSATYTIPIAVPPGRNGMQPELSLNYNSRSGNGIAGMGWSLSGASSIHLCPQTIAQDGQSRAVQLDGQDRLCMDGQRLVPISGAYPSSSYGAAGTVYDTEVRSFSQVTQTGALNSTSSSFSVLLKNGRMLTYGTTPSNSACGTSNISQVVPGSLSAPLSWLLTRTQDQQGNWMDYCYQAGAVGEVLLSKIVYTSNPAAAVARYVQFKYTARPTGTAGSDWSSSYIAGGLTMQTQRLSEIDTFGPNPAGTATEEVRSYTLSYLDPNNSQTYDLRTGRSLLWSVTECGYAPTTACRKPTTFNWADHPADFIAHTFQLNGVPAATPSGVPGQPAEITQVIADLDGDGTRELFVTQYGAGGYQSSLPQSNITHEYIVKTTADRATQGYVEVTSLPGSTYFSSPGFSADFGGDGKSEFIALPTGAGNISLFSWIGPRGQPIPTGPTGAPASSVLQTVTTNVPFNNAVGGDSFVAAADFDGDGYVDLLVTRSAGESCGAQTVPTGNVWLCLYTNSTKAPLGSSTTYQFSTGTFVYQWNPGVTTNAISIRPGVQSTDLNGDGVPDIIFQTEPVQYAPFTPSFVLMSARGKYPSGCTSLGQGIPFVSCAFAGTGGLNIPVDNAAGEAYSSGSFAYWMDVNGDGLTDLVYATEYGCTDVPTKSGNGRQFCIKLNTGNGFSPVIAATIASGGESLNDYGAGVLAYGGQFQIVDVDGDGRPEIVYPSALAARMCTVHNVSVSDTGKCLDGKSPIVSTGSGNSIQSVGTNDCPVYACSEDPSGVLSLPTSGSPSPFPIIPLHQTTNVGGTMVNFSNVDPSTYVMSALRFVQTGSSAFTVVKVPLTNTSEGATHTVLSSLGNNGTGLLPQSVYGDGLEDLTTQVLGCNPAWTVDGPYTNNVQILYQACYFDTTSSPTTLPDGTSVTSSSLYSDLEYINENIGAGVLGGDTLAPVLPELMSSAQNGLGDFAEWDYATLSSSAGRGSSLPPLYSVVDPSNPSDPYATPDTEYFFFQSSMPVVSSLFQSDGIGDVKGFRSSLYGYVGAIYDHLGRGFQGFRKISIDPVLLPNDVDANGYSRGLRTVTTYAQKFPLTGKIVEQDVGVATSGTTMTNVSTTTNNWGCNSSLTALPLRTQYCPADPTAPSAVATSLNSVYFPFLDTSLAYTYDLVKAQQGTSFLLDSILTYNASISSATRHNGTSGWDQYGNVVTQIVAKSDSDPAALLLLQYTITRNVYDPSSIASGWINKLQSSTTTFSVSDPSAHVPPTGVSTPIQIVETVYGWNCDRSVAWKATVDGNSTPTVSPQSGCGSSAVASVTGGTYATTSYTYPSPSYGLPLTSTVNASIPSTAPGTTFTPRTTTYGYSSDGYFVNSIKNPLSQTTSMLVRAEDGQTGTVTDPNGLEVVTSFDGFGHAISTAYYNPNGTSREPTAQSSWTSCVTSPATCSGDGDSAASYIVTTVKDGAPTQVVAYDILGRVIDKASRGFNGTYVHAGTTYDGMGTTASTTAPYYQGSATYSTTFKYDALNRMMQKVAPTSELNPTEGNTQTTYTYSGDTTTIAVKNLGTPACSPANLCFTMTRIGSVIGKYMQTTETDPNSAADGNTGGVVVTNYWYDGAGNTVGIQDGRGTTVSAVYNGLGQRTQSSDPNQGTWNFLYDGLGELITQTDARNAVTTVTSRDALGRVLGQTAVPPTPLPAIGGMTAEATQDTWIYDSEVIGAPTTITRQRGATLGALSTVWSEGYSYDPTSLRLITRSTTQEGESSALVTQYQYDTYYGREKAVTYPSGFTAWRQYNAYGDLSSLLDATSLSPGWTQMQTDAYGHTTSEEFGYAVLGSHVYSASTGQAEQLSWKTPTGGAIDSVTYGYDSLGNLTTQIRGGSSEAYGYDTLQRLQSDARTISGASQPTVSYQYDAVGDLMAKSDYSTATYGAYTYSTSKPNAVTSVALSAGGSASYAYDANGNVISGTVAENYDANNQARQITRGSGTVTFFYGSTGARYREVSSTETTIFGPDGYERTGTGTSATHRHELGPVVFTRTGVGGSSPTTTPNYMLRDRLGSVLTETDITGTILSSGAAQRSYDAFGKVRNGNFTDKVGGTLNLQPTTLRGFTGQEHQDDVQVIHMNGRIYDYQLGRFLGVDPMIGHPLSSQSMNPYSYIGNNPLSGVDPTGYFAHCMGDAACQAMDDADFLGGVVGKLKASLTYGGAPDGGFTGSNGAEKETPSMASLPAGSGADAILGADSRPNFSGGPDGENDPVSDSDKDVTNVGTINASGCAETPDLCPKGDPHKAGINDFQKNVLKNEKRVDNAAVGAVDVIETVVVNGIPVVGEIKDAQLAGKIATGTRRATKIEDTILELPALDATGKVHGVLPEAKDLGKYSIDELTQLRDELRQSIQKRIEVTTQKGSDFGHGERQAAEQQLLKSIEKHLEDR